VSDAAAPPATLAGGRYVLGALLGEGASKRVYLGHDQRLDRAVAIARVDTGGLDQSGRLRIEREAQAMARLGDHPNIVTVHDVLEEGGAIYIVTQYMSGGDLARRIVESPGGRLAVGEAVAIAIQICRALEHAQGRGVIHRDLKPANVWLAGDGTAKLGDFGLALALDRSRLTADGMIVGTVAYMPPEQALGRPRDGRSDLYALGATLYEMVTGRPPFLGEDMIAVLSQHIHTPPVAPGWLNPAIPQPLERLILDLLAKDPEARPAGAAAVRGRLQVLATAPLPSTTPPAAQAPSANPLDRLASGVFVGRSTEIERLRASFEEALSGRFRILLVSGEPGIGKTRIAEELTTYARMRGAEVLWGRCHDGPGAPPFWPWVQIVRGWLRDREPRELLADLGPGASDLATIVSELHDMLPGLAARPRLEPEQRGSACSKE
jgi:serine/threonine protein kinase